VRPSTPVTWMKRLSALEGEKMTEKVEIDYGNLTPKE
jgi:hypothetical protein